MVASKVVEPSRLLVFISSDMSAVRHLCRSTSSTPRRGAARRGSIVPSRYVCWLAPRGADDGQLIGTSSAMHQSTVGALYLRTDGRAAPRTNERVCAGHRSLGTAAMAARRSKVPIGRRRLPAVHLLDELGAPSVISRTARAESTAVADTARVTSLDSDVGVFCRSNTADR